MTLEQTIQEAIKEAMKAHDIVAMNATRAISTIVKKLLSCKQNKNMTTLQLAQEWDKTFPKSELVNHSKVTFHNRYGIELAADMYVPKETLRQAQGQ